MGKHSVLLPDGSSEVLDSSQGELQEFLSNRRGQMSDPDAMGIASIPDAETGIMRPHRIRLADYPALEHEYAQNGVQIHLITGNTEAGVQGLRTNDAIREERLREYFDNEYTLATGLNAAASGFSFGLSPVVQEALYGEDQMNAVRRVMAENPDAQVAGLLAPALAAFIPGMGGAAVRGIAGLPGNDIPRFAECVGKITASSIPGGNERTVLRQRAIDGRSGRGFFATRESSSGGNTEQAWNWRWR